MRNFLQNTFVRAFLTLVVLSALTHIALLAYQTIRMGDLLHLNFFRMLDITYFFPTLDDGLGMHLLSGAAAFVIYGIILAIQWKSSR